MRRWIANVLPWATSRLHTATVRGLGVAFALQACAEGAVDGAPGPDPLDAASLDREEAADVMKVDLGDDEGSGHRPGDAEATPPMDVHGDVPAEAAPPDEGIPTDAGPFDGPSDGPRPSEDGPPHEGASLPDSSAVRDDGPRGECGDGILDRASGEACDDGNRSDGDACSGDCRRVLCDVTLRSFLDPASGRCYWRDTRVVRRATAVMHCGAAGATLAMFGGEAERRAVYPAMGLGGSNRVWVGLQRAGSAWRWDDGADLSYVGFRAGEPSGDGPCAEWGPADSFNDVPCDVSRDFVCERAPPGRPR